MYLKQSTAVTVKLGPFLDESNGYDEETGLTISQADVRLSKAGGDFAQKNESSAATHDEAGYYDVDLDTTDTNTLGPLVVAVAETGARPYRKDYTVISAESYRLLVEGHDDIDQSDVPASRTAVIQQSSGSGLYAADTLEISVGDTDVLYAFDFRKDLRGERIASITSVTIYQSGGGAATEVTDSGTYWKDGTVAKAKLTGVSAATGLYAEVIVVYTNTTGTRKATVPITCVA